MDGQLHSTILFRVTLPHSKKGSAVVKIEGTLDNMRIVGPSIRTYTSRDLTVCPACGASMSGWWRRTIRKIKGKKDYHIVRMDYCPGDKPPTEEIRGLAGLLNGFGDLIHGCSGIPDPHLHCECQMCHAKWYTQLRERI